MRTELNKQYVKFSCRNCGKPIVLVMVNEAGKKVPFDAGIFPYNLHECEPDKDLQSQMDSVRAEVVETRTEFNRALNQLELDVQISLNAIMNKLKTARARGNL